MIFVEKYCPTCRRLMIMQYLYDEPSPHHDTLKYMKCLQCSLVVIYAGEPEPCIPEEQELFKQILSRQGIMSFKHKKKGK